MLRPTLLLSTLLLVGGALAAHAQSLKIMTFNTFLLPVPPATIGVSSMQDRVNLMLKGSLFNQLDVIVLNEAFDLGQSDKLINGLKSKGDNEVTPVLGRAYDPVDPLCASDTCWNAKKNDWGALQVMNGGVAIATRHKILRREEMIFSNKGCGFDATAAKGAVYTKIKLNGSGEIIHVFATHTQAADSLCRAGSDARARQAQFKEIRNWIAEKHIPAGEKVLIAGDLNVNKDNEEYQHMLTSLNVVEPRFEGAPASWDPATNKITGWTNPEAKSEYLDYVLSYKENADAGLTLRVLQATSAPGFFSYKAGNFAEYSDHYPVVAWTLGETELPVWESKPVERFQHVVFKSVLNGKYLSSNSKGELNFNADKGSAATFSLKEWISGSKASWPTSCILANPGDFIKVQASGTSSYVNIPNHSNIYKLINESPSKYLYMSTVNKNATGCLQMGDRILFSDMSALLYYYLAISAAGSLIQSDNPYFKEQPGTESQFIIESAQ